MSTRVHVLAHQLLHYLGHLWLGLHAMLFVPLIQFLTIKTSIERGNGHGEEAYPFVPLLHLGLQLLNRCSFLFLGIFTLIGYTTQRMKWSRGKDGDPERERARTRSIVKRARTRSIVKSIRISQNSEILSKTLSHGNHGGEGDGERGPPWCASWTR